MSFVARRVAAGAGLALGHSLRSRCDEQLVHVPSSMNLKLAGVIAEDALAEAHHVNLHPLAVVVLDAGGHDVLALREDGCGVMRVGIARGKAYACLAMGMPSRQIRDRLKDRPTFVGALSDVSGGRFVPVPGGVLVVDEESGVAIGAVGVSGDTSDKDEMVAIVAINKQDGVAANPAAPSATWARSSLGPH